MFGDLLKDLKGALGDFGGFSANGGSSATRTITVAKPFCTPARDIVTAAFQPYGVKILKYREYTDTIWFPGGKLPRLQVGEVTVSAKAAVWAEYLLLRTGRLRIYGEYQDRRNEAWAAKHAGQMPPPWQEGKPWIESSCSAGKEAWRTAKAKQKGKGKQ